MHNSGNTDSGQAPDSLEQLSRVLTEVKAGTSPVKLGRRAREVLEGMMTSPQQAALYPISYLANSFHVNPSTLTRLAKSLGYRGFSDLQAVFREHAAGGDSYYSERAGNLFNEDGSSHESLNLAARIANEETANIATMLGNIQAETLDGVVDLLCTAQRIRAHGLRQSYPIADYLSYGLGLIRGDVAVLSIAEHGITHGLSQLEPGDLLFTVGCSPFTRSTVTAARVAREQGIDVVTITDSFSSPLAAYARHTLISPTTGTYFSNSMSASLVLIEVLLTLVARKLGDKAIASLKHYEKLIGQMQFDI